MPCHPAKARILLGQGKAVPLNNGGPFAVRHLYGSSGYPQPITRGVDSGYAKVGLSALTARQEVSASEVALRTDMVKLNSERRQYRRDKRYRKTWYREPRFNNRRKPEGWLAPSPQNELDTHVKVIGAVQQILPITGIIVEVAAFDIQKIKDPHLSGKGYQDGPQRDFWNAREYVLFRDDHTCQCCTGKSKHAVLEVHHRESRQTGEDRPLCKTCHDVVTEGEVLLRAGKPSKGFGTETFMTMVR